MPKAKSAKKKPKRAVKKTAVKKKNATKTLIMVKKSLMKASKRKVVKPAQKRAVTPALTKVVRRKTKPFFIPKNVESQMLLTTLEDAEKFFNLRNGRKLKSVHDLAKNLERMSEDVFSYHVTPYKNDFSAWLYMSFGLVELARMLANEKTKKGTFEIIVDYYRK